MPEKPYFERLAQSVEKEISLTARSIAQQLPFAHESHDTKAVSVKEMEEHIARNAETPGFLQSILDRMAPADPSGMRPENGLRYYLTLMKRAVPEIYYEGTGETPKVLGVLGPDHAAIKDILSRLDGGTPSENPWYSEPNKEPMLDDPYQGEGVV